MDRAANIHASSEVPEGTRLFARLAPPPDFFTTIFGEPAAGPGPGGPDLRTGRDRMPPFGSGVPSPGRLQAQDAGAGRQERHPERTSAAEPRTGGTVSDLPLLLQCISKLLDRVEAATSRLSSCEASVLRLERQADAIAARIETELQESERRLELRIDRSIAALEARMERRHHAFVKRHASFLKILATTVRDLSDRSLPAAAATACPDAQPRAAPHHAPAHGTEEEPELRSKPGDAGFATLDEDIGYGDWLGSLLRHPDGCGNDAEAAQACRHAALLAA